MKKFILFLIVMLVLPVAVTYAYGLLAKDVRIGKGSDRIENRLMGKEIVIELNGLYKSMDVEEYVLGVLPGTIPADYDLDTLKVQAILIRTNVLKEMQEKNTSDAADLSYTYMTVEERIALWGDKNYEKRERLFEQAVADTAGMVIEKEGSLIMALYHEVSIGKTASAKEILGEDISYLQSVESGQDLEAKHYMNLITYSYEEVNALIKEKLENTGEEQVAEGDNGQKAAIVVEESTENGFVKKASVNGTEYTGEEMMQLFELSSTNFYVEEQEGGLRFVCLGKGNCLGVSQYGANCMAAEGYTVEEIIKYYYRGVSVSEYQSQ